MRDLTETMRRRVRNRLISLENDPYRGASKLSARPGFRARVGNYSLLYEVDDQKKVVRVDQIVHRREAYR